MKEKNSAKIGVSVILLIFSIIIIIVMSIYIYIEKTNSETKISNLEKNITDMQNTITNLQANRNNQEANESQENNKLEENDELSYFLGNIAAINSFKDLNISNVTFSSFNEGIKLDICSNLIAEKANTNDSIISYNKTDINSSIKEIFNENITNIIDSDYSLLKYDSNKNCYVYKEAGDVTHSAYFIKMDSQTYSDGIYTITFLYAYPSEWEILENNLGDCDCYRMTAKIKLNDNYSYSKYQLINSSSITSESLGKVKDNM